MMPSLRTMTICAIEAIALSVTGCGSVQIEAGARFEPSKLESALQPGVSSQSEVAEALGEPYGRGVALLPFHEAPRVTWTYFYERGIVDTGSGWPTKDQRIYLFVFFEGDTLNSYMWFPSVLEAVIK